jgi:glycosyltransferase involved in cell wall biosynthesis
MADDPVVKRGRIGVLLPWREHFALQRSGAVALCARDFARFSRFSDRIDVLGAAACEYADISYRRIEGWKRWWRRDRAAYAAAAAAALAGYGLIEAQNRPYLVPALRLRWPQARLALHLHNDPQTMDGARSAGERAGLLAACDAIYCVSDFIRARFLDGLEDKAGKAVTILNGVPLPQALVPKEPIIAFTGRVAAIKGVVELARAFAAAELPGWRLVIAGGDPGKLMAPAEGVDVLGQVSHAEAMALLARAEIAAAPSMWDDPCPRAAIEALAHGCALLTSRRGGLPEIAEGAAGFVDPADTAGFAAALRRLAEDAAFRRDLQARARARAAERLDIRVGVARLDAVRARLLRL